MGDTCIALTQSMVCNSTEVLWKSQNRLLLPYDVPSKSLIEYSQMKLLHRRAR